MGIKTAAIQLTTGAGASKIAVSDADGNMTWGASTTGGDAVILHQTVSNGNDIDITVDGDADEIIEIEFQGKIQNNSADHLWYLRPNNANSTTNYYSNVLQVIDGSASASNETLAGFLFWYSGESGSYTTEGCCKAVIYTKSGCYRMCQITFTSYNNVGKNIQMHRQACWKDSSTNMTSIKMAWSAAPASVSGTLLVRKKKLS